MTTELNPTRYRELSEPFESTEEATAAVTRFIEAVSAARVECGLPDVYIIAEVNVAYPEGENAAISTLHLGSSAKALQLTAYAYGREKKSHEEMIAGVMRDAERRGR